jgi:hypothetical protein
VLDAAYIPIRRYWPPNGKPVREDRELQVQPRPDEDIFDSTNFTSLRVHSRETGDPVSGEAVLDADQLAELYLWLGERLAELRHPAAPTSAGS